ncbi:MAG: FecR domain-containing protein [Spirochaetes bacterium]|nr:FecR domain-containing protein [Spirochaetota bacterium]MBN2772340.1 FecR domain-containing protein [Spirochaetota bacterium]
MITVKKLLLILFAMTFSLPAFSAMQIKFFVGEAKIKPFGSDTWQKASMNQKLVNGDTVKTGSKAYIQIDMDGNTIKVNENTQLAIGQDIDEEKKVQSLDMTRGTVQLKMDKLQNNNSGFKVNTVSTVCAVRGTEFLVAAGYDGTSVLQVQKGRVAITGSSRTVLVNANQETTVPYGGDPSEVEDIKISEWNKWISDSKNQLKGNEESVLNESLKKIKKLDNDITELEEIKEFNQKEKIKYDELAKKFKADGNTAKFEENAKLSFQAAQKLHLASFRAIVNAYKMGMVKDFSDLTYETIDRSNRTAEINKLYMEIDDLYKKYYIKYIKAAVEAKQKRDELRKKRNRR